MSLALWIIRDVLETMNWMQNSQPIKAVQTIECFSMMSNYGYENNTYLDSHQYYESDPLF